MIQRDGALVSLWQDHAQEYEPVATASTDKRYDVIIAGGGITGVSTALKLQRAGLQCLLLEAHTLCFGTTGGTTAHLNTLMDTPYTTIIKNFGKEKAALVAQSARQALADTKQNIAEYAISCGHREADAFLFSQDKSQTKELEALLEACGEVGLEAAYTDNIPLSMDFDKAMRVGGQARFSPVQYVHALAAAFEKQGGIIVQHCRIAAADNTDPVTVTTNRGTYTGGWLVYATHIPPGISLLNLRCAPYRSYAMALTLADDRYPDGLVYDMYDPYHYYRTQEIDGTPYLIAGGKDHKTGHSENTNACFLQLEAHLRKHFNIKNITNRWSSQYFEPADGLPYIGHMPGQPGKILVASGYGGNGMTYSTVAARLLTDIITGVDSPYSDLYNPNRIKPVAGFANMVKENADVVKQLVGTLFPKEAIDTLSELAPGEGRVVSYESHRLAVSRDERQQVHAVNAACTHMKCGVTWNQAEQSWDCPCHGARYDRDGNVLTGPADKGLEKAGLEEQ